MRVYDKYLLGFVTTDSKIIVYLKQSSDDNKYVVKVLHRDGTKTIVKETYSLSGAMREIAETIAQFTGGFTTWRQVP